MKFFILTDLEGPAGVDRFSQTRTTSLEDKAEAMMQLAKEVNACMEGIRSVDAAAEIVVWDGHGSGGLREEDLQACTYLPPRTKAAFELEGFDALLFVGQHAMAGTVFAPLCHTYNSRSVNYYKLNGCFIGEFGARALSAGYQGVPTIFLSGDDKAAAEARMFVPEIETVATKLGTGLESAVHLDKEEACRRIREGAAAAVRRRNEIPPFIGLKPPFVFEAGYYNEIDQSAWSGRAGEITFPDTRTVRIVTDRLQDLPI
ncbi:M55 family metallopeptidase [Paenibacillus allorhizosphaerae]|uniref:D-aminopeptidase n=1 Tax=Paenibacillus allorhizosphaerae TaxID=2849866 RepID=A0ABN7TR24_9BACL|nr:M55 family metallopeptidase [Paenibacillus allorhizosphaerae]CAG7652219.1 D-aminopeptidase [Paenibacillus allorhizosphaerae]